MMMEDAVDPILQDVLYIFQLQRVIAERQALESLNRKLVPWSRKKVQRGPAAIVRQFFFITTKQTARLPVGN